jgi:hypothetical protein
MATQLEIASLSPITEDEETNDITIEEPHSQDVNLLAPLISSGQAPSLNENLSNPVDAITASMTQGNNFPESFCSGPWMDDFERSEVTNQSSALDWLIEKKFPVNILVMGIINTSTKKIKTDASLCLNWELIRCQILKDKLGIPRDRHKKANLSCRYASFKEKHQQDIGNEEEWRDILLEVAESEKERYEQKEAGKKRLTDSKLPICIEVMNPVSDVFIYFNNLLIDGSRRTS